MPADSTRHSRQRKSRGTFQTPQETIAAVMNSESVLGIIRHIITTAGGALVANGTLEADQLNTGAGAVAVIIGLVWSIIAKRKSAKA